MSTGGSLADVFAVLTGRRDVDGKILGERREETRARIVAAATTELLAHGYADMRVDDVARRARVTRPTLYAYFESKELLLIAAMSEEAMSQLAGIAPLFDSARPAEDRLRDWVRETILYVVKAPLTARMARDRSPEVLRILMEHPLAQRALGMNADLDKGRLFSGLIRTAFPGAFTEREATEVASLMRAVSHLAPALLDDHALFGQSVSTLAEWWSQLLVGGMRARTPDVVAKGRDRDKSQRHAKRRT